MNNFALKKVVNCFFIQKEITVITRHIHQQYFRNIEERF
jgi:hypothetical protein